MVQIKAETQVRHSEVQTSTNLAELDRQMMAEILDPATPSILINIDWQVDYGGKDGKANMLWNQDIGSAQEALKHAEEVTAAFRTLRKEVIFTQNFEDIQGRNKARMARAIRLEKVATPEDEAFGVAAVSGTPGAEIMMDVRPGERVFQKTVESAYTPEMKDHIKESGAKVVFITGLRTEKCVRTTVTHIYNDAEVYVVVLTDAVASDNVALDELTKKLFETFYPPTLTTVELLAAWKSALDVAAPQAAA